MHIVILGAGYGGMRVANVLGRRLGGRGEAKITLVNADPRHVLTTELHKVAAGTAAPEDVTVRLDRALPVKGLDIRIGLVTRIDPTRQLVFLAEDEPLVYDYLVVALGSTVEYWGIPGLAENAHAIGGLQGAIRIREAVKRAIDTAATQNRIARIVIGGGGLTGVEVAGELAQQLKQSERKHGTKWEIVLLEMAPGLLPGLPEDLGHKATKLLLGLGVTVRTGLGIAAVEPGELQLANACRLSYDTLIWAGGVRGNPVVAEAFAADSRDRAYVDAYLRAEGYPNVYIIGDTALARVAKTGEPVPPTAQAALQQADVAAAHLLHRLTGTPPYVAPYAGRNRGVLVSVGPHMGLGQWGPMRGSGWMWKLLKDANDFRYRTKVKAVAGW